MTRFSIFAWVGAGLFMILLGGCGMSCAYVGGQLYADHQLLNEIRKAREQELVQAAERVRQFQAQQAQGQPAK